MIRSFFVETVRLVCCATIGVASLVIGDIILGTFQSPFYTPWSQVESGVMVGLALYLLIKAATPMLFKLASRIATAQQNAESEFDLEPMV